MGGLVTRAFLLKNRPVADHTLFAYFLSTPTTGSQIASIARFVSSNPQIGLLRTMNAEDYLADLLRNWLSAGFKFPSYCAYERLPTNGLALVVGMESASALCTKPLDPIETDHISIAKPSSQNSPSYIAFKSAFADIRIPELKGELDDREKRRSIRITLGNLLQQGLQLMAVCADETRPSPETEADAWAARAEGFFHASLDDSYVARFRTSSGFSFSIGSIKSPQRNNLWNGINNRTTRLQEFIKEYVN
jgi:hypothetical protein